MYSSIKNNKVYIIKNSKIWEWTLLSKLPVPFYKQEP